MHECPCITLALTVNKEGNKWGALWRFWGELISGTAADLLAVIKQPEISLERLLPCCGFHTLAHMSSCVCRWNAEKGRWPWSIHLPYAKRRQVPHEALRNKSWTCPAVITSPRSLPLTTYPGVFRTLTHSAPPSVKDCVTMESHKRRKNPHSNPL